MPHLHEFSNTMENSCKCGIKPLVLISNGQLVNEDIDEDGKSGYQISREKFEPEPGLELGCPDL